MDTETSTGSDLGKATATELLLHALTLGGAEGSLGERMLDGVSDHLSLISTLCLAARPGAHVDLGDVGVSLERLTRQLDVARELLARESRPEPETSEPH